MDKKFNLKNAVACANYVLDICLAHECSCTEAMMLIMEDMFIGEPASHRENIEKIGMMNEFNAGCEMLVAVEAKANGELGSSGQISAKWASDGTIDLQYIGIRSGVNS